ncbi:hypothetical protein ACHQM5_018837 [Ranunculus cassubicifolius]
MKRKKKNKHSSADQEVPIDRISDLPESIRNHIVSFLPMEDAIRTSILSKPWRNVCATFTNLNFDQRVFVKMTGSKTGFIDSVYRLIGCRDGSCVKFFRVVVDVDEETVSHIRAWIDFALRCNVKELLFSVVSGNLSIPCEMFSSRTLVSLCLSGVVLNVPMVVGFPMVKMLKLKKVVWSDDEQTNRLIGSCPLLETLIIAKCTWNSAKLLRISAPNLKTILLAPASPDQEVKISSANLREFRYLGNPPDISSKSLSSLVWASLYLFPFADRTTKIAEKDVTLRVTKIFMGLRNVRRLLLENFSVEVLSRDRDLLSKNISSFCYVKELSLTVFTTTNQLQFVASLVTICSNLFFLNITFKEHAEYEHVLDMEGYFQPQQWSELGTLEYIYIREFNGSDNELYLIQHLLANAKILKHLTVTCSKELSRDAQKNVTLDHKIQQFVKVSPLQQYCMSK